MEEVENRVERYGSNQVAHEKPIPWYIQLFKAFINLLYWFFKEFISSISFFFISMSKN